MSAHGASCAHFSTIGRNAIPTARATAEMTASIESMLMPIWPITMGRICIHKEGLEREQHEWAHGWVDRLFRVGHNGLYGPPR